MCTMTMNEYNQELEQAIKNLTIDELNGVLDALALVVEHYDMKDVSEGIYLVPPYGEHIASGRMKCFVKPKHDERLVGSKVLVSGKMAYGIVNVGDPKLVSIDEFDVLFGKEHRVSRKSRLKWWPDVDELYLYPVSIVNLYDSAKDVVVEPGVQTHMKSVVFQENVKHCSLKVKVASLGTESETGFSGRKSIDSNEGLLIPLGYGTGIWMKDTDIHLSVAFLDENYKVLQVTELTPNDETVHLGPDDGKWALEASPEWFRDESVEIGDIIKGIE